MIPARAPSQSKLFDLLASEFHNPAQVFELMNDFLGRSAFDRDFCQKLIALGKQRKGIPWNLRRLAVLILENQILRIDPHDLNTFDWVFVQLNLKRAGIDRALAKQVLKEGFTSTELRRFVPEFRRRLARLNRIHERIVGRRTPHAALRDFFNISRQHCKLAVSRYLFTPEEIVAEIFNETLDSSGVKDIDLSEASFIEDEITRAIDMMPDYEAEILKRLRRGSKIFWVSEKTSSRLNSMVEYPLKTVVLVIKPPGSEIEFEIKRAGLRGDNSLDIIYARKGYTVPPSHRLDGGSMQWMLRYESDSGTRMGRAYRHIHGTEAPVPAYLARASIYTIPTRHGEMTTMNYFTEKRAFGSRFSQMRAAMRDSVEAFANEGHYKLPPLQDALSLAAQFIGQVTPAQAIMSGTSTFRLDKIDKYLSNAGPDQYFKDGLRVAYSPDDARQLADTILEEILGVYQPPDVRYKSQEQYVAAAFSLTGNRLRANEVYLSIVDQIAKFWGTLLGLRMHTRGESFVARNVGLKSYWEKGEWKVKIIFMDHDAVTLHGPSEHFFWADSAIPTMALDESYIWSRNSRHFPTCELGYLQRIYRIGKETDRKGDEIAHRSLKDAYTKTRSALQTNQRLRSLFHKRFLERLLDWDIFVDGYLAMNGNREGSKFVKKMKERLEKHGYKAGAFDRMGETVEKNRKFLERYSYLFEPPY